MVTTKRWLPSIMICLFACGMENPYLPAHFRQSVCQAQETSRDLSTPQKTIETFVDAIKKGNMTQAAKCVVNGKPNSSLALAGAGKEISVTRASYQIAGEKAVFTATTSLGAPGAQNAYPLQERLELKKSGAEWHILAPEQVASGYLTQFAILLGRPELLKGEQTKRIEISCLSDMRQLGTACMMFLQDHQEAFALQAKKYKEALLPYVRNEKIFQCPLDRSGMVSYAFNANLEGRKQADLKAPAQTVMLYEGKESKLLFRHNGKAGVVFADGHAQMLTEEQAKSLIWKG